MSGETVRKKLTIGYDETEYVCGKNAIEAENDEGTFIVSETISNIYPEKIKRFSEGKIIFVEDGENSKRIDNYEEVCRILMEREVERNSYLTYIGGGTIGDLSGFIASTYKRGLRLKAIPTTLLSQIDSSIGGKNGINFSGVKNAIGTFRNPERIVADTDFLMKNDQIIREGMAEIIKHGFSMDYTIIETLLNNDMESVKNGDILRDLIVKNADIKASVCNQDPYELLGRRYVLNFGHTVAHGIEAISRNRITHGAAVIYGIMYEMKMSEIYGMMKYDGISIMNKLMKRYGVNKIAVSDEMLDGSLSYIMNDKKIRNGKISIPMATKPGITNMAELKIEVFKELFLKAGRMM